MANRWSAASGGTPEIVKDGVTGILVPPGTPVPWRSPRNPVAGIRRGQAAWAPPVAIARRPLHHRAHAERRCGCTRTLAAEIA
jgi:hypothetical protein